MAETLTAGHNLKKYDDGDNPGAANLNSNWDKIDTRLTGIGNALPAQYPPTGMFLRRTDNRLFENTGTFAVPVWTLRLEPPGVGSAHTHIWNEVPVGTIDGVNPTFTLTGPPSPPASLTLYKNGMLMKAGGFDFTLVGAVITFIPATVPGGSDVLLASYTT
jgi:hypothetical protein